MVGGEAPEASARRSRRPRRAPCTNDEAEAPRPGAASASRVLLRSSAGRQPMYLIISFAVPASGSSGASSTNFCRCCLAFAFSSALAYDSPSM